MGWSPAVKIRILIGMSRRIELRILYASRSCENKLEEGFVACPVSRGGSLGKMFYVPEEPVGPKNVLDVRQARMGASGRFWKFCLLRPGRRDSAKKRTQKNAGRERTTGFTAGT